MPVKIIIKVGEYQDSVRLMLVGRELTRLAGVVDAAAVMATEANKAILKEAGLFTDEVLKATPNDLVIAINATDEVANRALAEAEKLLQKKMAEPACETGSLIPAYRPRTLRGAVKSTPNANVAVISVAGRYAAAEAWEALHLGLHTLLFSDNVSLEDEIALKKYARQAGLLLMGPGAGTAYLNGAALGFANVVPAGPVGIVSAAGTGLQEVSCLLAREGAGITQGLGTGGRDLSQEVGGVMMLSGLQALQEDPATEVIILVSKPPARMIALKVIEQVGLCAKPTIICFLGGDPGLVKDVPRARFACTLQEAALLGAQAVRGHLTGLDEMLAGEDHALEIKADEIRARLQPQPRYLRGLFSGGTLCYEAQAIWQDLLAEPVWSNAPLRKENKMPNSSHSMGHTAIDLGEEEFTVGRPHPMIDNDLRIRRILQEARDAQVAVLMLDVVLGYGAHPDPGAELGAAVRRAQKLAQEDGRELVVVASITGTKEDPQDFDRQARLLEEAGVILCQSNAAAARLTAKIVGGG